MNHLTREYVTKLKDSLLFINAVVIIYNASLFLLSTKYISVHYYARDFLNKVSYIIRTIYFLFIMKKNVDTSILSADYILVDFAFWHTFDIFCFENIVYSI